MNKRVVGLLSFLIVVLSLFLYQASALRINGNGTAVAAAGALATGDQQLSELDPMAPTGLWVSNPIYAPKSFKNMGAHALRYDSQGHPHVVFGGDHLYYAYHDGAEWRVETVDHRGGVGQAASLALDSADRPHIAYSVGSTFDAVLNYVHWDGNQWNFHASDSMKAETGVQGIARIAVTSSGRPHILYRQYQDGDHNSRLHHVYWDGQEWQTELVAEYGLYHALALDDNDTPHISYYGGEYGNPDVYYGHKENGQWQFEYVANGYPYQTDLVIDHQGRPHIAYYEDAFDTELQHAYKDGDAWLPTTVDVEVGGRVSLAVDDSDVPMMAYTNYHELYFAAWDGDNWNAQKVGDGPSSLGLDGGPSPSLALDDQGQPTILFLNQDYSLRLARPEGGGWAAEMIAAGGDAGMDAPHDMVLDHDGRLQAIIYDRLQRRLYYAQLHEGAWLTEVVTQTDVSPFADAAVSLAVDDLNRPHISYKIGSDTANLVYAHDDGSGWTFEVLDQPYNTPNAIDVDSQGRPHIAYCGDGGLHYTYWSGSEWSTATLNDGCFYTVDMKLDSLDRPHIAFDSGYTFHYASWTGAELADQVLDRDELVYDASLDLDSLDRPHLFYRYDWYVKYARWNGSEWEMEAVTPEGTSAPIHGGETSMTLDAGDRPHLAWCQWDEGLHYARLIQGNWRVQLVDDRFCSSSSSRGTSIVLDNAGRPLIGYHLELEGDFMLASRPVLEEHIYLPAIMK